jgi:hypothetical protein
VVKILTDAACRKFVPGPKRRRIRDAAARSLFLVVEPSGHKAWRHGRWVLDFCGHRGNRGSSMD